MYSGGVGKEVYDHEIVFWGFTSNYEGIEFFAICGRGREEVFKRCGKYRS